MTQKKRNVGAFNGSPAIDTPEKLFLARNALKWSANQMAFALGMTSSFQGPDGEDRGGNKAGLRVLEMERGARPITGPVAIAVEAFSKGFVPAHFLREFEIG